MWLGYLRHVHETGGHHRQDHGWQPQCSAISTLLTDVQEAAAYFEMARLVNLLPSCILTYLGAWVSHIPYALCHIAFAIS